MSQSYFPTITNDIKPLPIYLCSVGVNFEEKGIERPHGYPAYQWIQCEEGEGIFINNGKEYSITPSNGMFINPDEAHEYYPTKKPWITSWLSFDGNNLDPILVPLGLDSTSIYIMKNKKLLHHMMTHSYGLATSNNPIWYLEASAYTYGFLMELVKHIQGLDNLPLYDKHFRLQPVINYIDSHYYESVTIEELSSVIQVTPQYLCALFKKYLKKRPFEYINMVRINKSKELMINHPELAIHSLCRTVGFDHPSYFGLQFKKFVGMTPGQFRQLHLK